MGSEASQADTQSRRKCTDSFRAASLLHNQQQPDNGKQSSEKLAAALSVMASLLEASPAAAQCAAMSSVKEGGTNGELSFLSALQRCIIRSSHLGEGRSLQASSELPNHFDRSATDDLRCSFGWDPSREEQESTLFLIDPLTSAKTIVCRRSHFEAL